MNDERLRELYGRSAVRSATRRGEECPPPEAIRALVEREGPEEERLRILDHVMACESCRRDLDLLRAIRAAGDEMEGRKRTSARPAWTRWAPLALAATVLLAFATVWMTRTGTEDRYRGGVDALAVVAPAGDVTAAPRLVWHPAAGVVRYTVEVLDGSDRVVYGATVSDTVAPVPAGRLAAGTEYRWWVRSAEPATPQLRSGFTAFRLTR